MDPAPAEAGRQNRPHQYVILGLLVAGLLFFAIRRQVLGREQIVYFAVLIPSIILHEVSHGAVALAFGDHTAQRAGRLTLNPIKHIDPFWTIILPAIMVFTTGRAFGMAKPVPVNQGLMRSPRNHGLLTSLAGPATNIVLAGVSIVVYRLLRPAGMAGEAVVLFGLSNVVLAAFNLIPIPPLDGSALLERALPNRLVVPYLRIRQYSFFVFIALFFLASDLFSVWMDPAVELWFQLLLG